MIFFLLNIVYQGIDIYTSRDTLRNWRNTLNNERTWTFPKEISLEEVPQYSRLLDKCEFNQFISFDLTNTVNVHSSFIGFLLHAKNHISSRGGDLYIYPSQAVTKIINLMQLKDYLLH